MTTVATRWAAILTAAFLAALCGVGAGRLLMPPPKAPGAELHHVIHEQLDLDARQQAALDALEARFAVRRKALELQMRADNARLAAAIEAEHGYGPDVVEAVTASHLTMGTLQKETLAHIFAMRKLLRPEQAAKFDAAVARTLTTDIR